MKYLFPSFQWHACELAKLSACIDTKCMITINMIELNLFLFPGWCLHGLCHNISCVWRHNNHLLRHLHCTASILWLLVWLKSLVQLWCRTGYNSNHLGSWYCWVCNRNLRSCPVLLYHFLLHCLTPASKWFLLVSLFWISLHVSLYISYKIHIILPAICDL